jgi:hypothetical protein
MKGGATVSAFGTAAVVGGTDMAMSPLWTYGIYVSMFVILGMIVYMLWLLLARINSHPTNHGQAEHAENTVNLFGPLGSIPTRSDPFNDPYVPPLKVDTTYFPTRSFYDPRVGGDQVASGPNDSGDIRGLPVVAGLAGSRGYGAGSIPSVPLVPINVRTRGYEPEFSQLGILVRDRGASEQDKDRRGGIGREKYQSTFGMKDDPNDTTHVNPRADSSSLYDNQILPLMGRRVLNGRDKYQYYTLGGAGNNTKLPIQVRGRNAMDENGVDEITDRDRTFVPGYDHAYRADIYQNALYRYLPSFL